MAQRFFDWLLRKKYLEDDEELFELIIGDYVLEEIDKATEMPDWYATQFNCLLPPSDHFVIEASSTIADFHTCTFFYVTRSKSGIQYKIKNAMMQKKQVVVNPMYTTLTVDQDGVVVGDIQNLTLYSPINFGEMVDSQKKIDKLVREYGSLLSQALPYSLRTLDLLNCSNVKLVNTVIPPKDARRYRVHHKRELKVFKELHVKRSNVNLSFASPVTGETVRGRVVKQPDGSFRWQKQRSKKIK